MGVDPLTVHLVRLRGFPQLGQDEAAAPLRGGVHLKHLQPPEGSKGEILALGSESVATGAARRSPTLKPSS